ncbi:ankyrin repeat domain-containing protein [Bordetella trematum]|uniref:ankyrin repeat domain-containing protein n=1 Tax=Bordetella trematum TaxID=123899 RepID=UPI003AF36E8C
MAMTGRTWIAAVALALPLAAGWAAEPPANWWFYVHNDKVADLQTLLKQGADPNVRFKNGQPAIMRAVVDQAWKVFDALAADPRTDVNAVNPAGETPLMYLAVTGQTERARKLIARGAEVNRLGWTPLHYAASKGHVDTAKLLMSKGALINAPSSEGRTPLMMAALSGNREMVQLLLDAGADPTTQDLKGQTAADWALTGKWGGLSKALAEVSESTWRQREAARGGAALPAAASPATAAPSSETAPKAAAQTDTPAAGSVQGVSGLKLGTYD